MLLDAPGSWAHWTLLVHRKESTIVVSAVSTPRGGTASAQFEHSFHALRHPILTDRGYSDWNVVIGVSKESLTFWDRPCRPQHGTSCFVGVVRQDRQQRSVLDPPGIEHWSPGIATKLQSSRERHATMDLSERSVGGAAAILYTIIETAYAARSIGTFMPNCAETAPPAFVLSEPAQPSVAGTPEELSRHSSA
jgi:hypothetical protein